LRSYKDITAKFNAAKNIKSTKKRIAAYKKLFSDFKSWNKLSKCGYETYIISLEKYTWDHETRIEIARKEAVRKATCARYETSAKVKFAKIKIMKPKNIAPVKAAFKKFFADLKKFNKAHSCQMTSWISKLTIES
jgi:hypothetical protein